MVRPNELMPGSPSRLGRPAFPNVTVILGDPRLPDPIKRGKQFNPEDFDAFDRMKDALSRLSDYRFTYLDNHSTLLSDLIDHVPTFVLNFCDTGYKNVASHELHIPALLEMLDIHYSGAGPVCLGLCYDKMLVRALASAHGIPVPVEHYLDAGDEDINITTVFPALVKPGCADGSVGITKDAVVHSYADARVYIKRLRAELPNQAVLIQEFLEGAEYSIGLIGNPGFDFTVLPPLQVDYSALDPGLPHILAYESKADPSSPYWRQIKFREARIDEPTCTRLAGYSKYLFERLRCRDYARFDFRTDSNGVIKLLEVNPNPAWCWDGKLNLMSEFAGCSYSQFLQLILEAAQARVVAGGPPDLANS